MLAGAARRDAITNHALATRTLFRSYGWRSEIFTDPIHTAADLRAETLDYRQWSTVVGREDAAILHYSIDSPAFIFVAERCPRAAIQYHNITPPHLLWRFSPALAQQCLEGRRVLSSFASMAPQASAVSHFNAEELYELGFPRVTVTGILRQARGPRRARYPVPAPRLLFVGRGAPNKAQHDLILSMAALTQQGFQAELRLAGSWGGNRAYREHCERLTTRLGLEERVVFLDSVSDEELRAEYASAAVFVCLSDHEGYCVPLVEALECGVPVVAFAAGAVPETAEGAAILLSDKSPSLVAEAVMALLAGEISVSEQGRFAALGRHSADVVGRRLLQFGAELLEL